MTTGLFLRTAIEPALALLPEAMHTPEARALVLAIALQESRLRHRRQIGGPARGYCQFEQGGGCTGVLTHRASTVHAQVICTALDVTPTPAAVYAALEFQDLLAASFARLLLWTDPEALPTDQGMDGAEAGWRIYLRTWRPGKPHEGTWPECYARAWSTVEAA